MKKASAKPVFYFPEEAISERVKCDFAKQVQGCNDKD
jgi:hypothetical protein